MRVRTIYIEHPPTPWCAHGGFGRNSYNKKQKEKNEFIKQIKSQWNSKLITTPVELIINHAMPMPQSMSTAKRTQAVGGSIFHIKRPDTTNLNKFAEDCLKGIVLEDDSIVVSITGRKFYALRPNVTIWIKELIETEE